MVEQSLLAVGDVIEFSFFVDCLLKVPGMKDGQDVLVAFWPGKGAAALLTPVHDGTGDFILSRGKGRGIEGPLVLGKKSGEFLPGCLRKAWVNTII
jgi:hypothetical protein